MPPTFKNKTKEHPLRMFPRLNQSYLKVEFLEKQLQILGIDAGALTFCVNVVLKLFVVENQNMATWFGRHLVALLKIDNPAI